MDYRDASWPKCKKNKPGTSWAFQSMRFSFFHQGFFPAPGRYWPLKAPECGLAMLSQGNDINLVAATRKSFRIPLDAAIVFIMRVGDHTRSHFTFPALAPIAIPSQRFLQDPSDASFSHRVLAMALNLLFPEPPPSGKANHVAIRLEAYFVYEFPLSKEMVVPAPSETHLYPRKIRQRKNGVRAREFLLNSSLLASPRSLLPLKQLLQNTSPQSRSVLRFH